MPIKVKKVSKKFTDHFGWRLEILFAQCLPGANTELSALEFHTKYRLSVADILQYTKNKNTLTHHSTGNEEKKGFVR